MISRLARHSLRVALILLALVSPLGCQSDDIESYSTPRFSEDPSSGNVRLRVAIVPTADATWFFKLVGRQDIIEMVEPAFQRVIESIEYNEKNKPELTWKVPANWQEDRENPNRVATIRPEGVGKPEIAITRLEGKAALKPNLDRWRRIDLGLGPISGKVMGKVTQTKKVGPLELTLVDMRGPGVQKSDTPKMPPLKGGGGPASPPANRGPLTYTVPDGWREGGGSGIAAAAFSMSEGSRSARLLVTPLNGSMPGGLLANVNRWRGEVELPALSDADLKSLPTRTLRVANLEAKALDLDGKNERSLVVWLETSGRTWFFKLRGSKDVVEKNKEKFEAFLQSVKFR